MLTGGGVSATHLKTRGWKECLLDYITKVDRPGTEMCIWPVILILFFFMLYIYIKICVTFQTFPGGC